MTIPGDPRVELFGPGAPSVLGFRIAERGRSDIPASPLSEISIDQVRINGNLYTQITTVNHHLQADFYSVGCLVADRVQLQGMSPGAAISDVLGSMAELLARRSILDEERAVGLFGELWFLRALAPALSWQRVLDAWVAPQAEQHDFALGDTDIEVKTTASERRSHVIHGLTQLSPTPQRALYLLSMHLTRVGEGGESLPGLIRGIRLQMESAFAAGLPVLHGGLTAAGWLDDFAPFTDQRYVLRSAPFLIPASQIPGITPAVLRLEPADLARVSDVRYRIDVTGLGEPCPTDGIRIELPTTGGC
jgi:hypothetical protein